MNCEINSLFLLFQVFVFETCEDEWAYALSIIITDRLAMLEYVIDCRRGGHMQELYDIVEGGVANDNVIDTVEDYENGIITAEQALGQLRYKKINHQICILNQEIIDKYLIFTESKVLNE